MRNNTSTRGRTLGRTLGSPKTGRSSRGCCELGISLKFNNDDLSLVGKETVCRNPLTNYILILYLLSTIKNE